MTTPSVPGAPPASAARRVAFAIAALALSITVCVLIGELVLRRVVSLPLARPAPEVRYVEDSVRRFRLRPSQHAFTYGAPVTIDARGFRTNGAALPDSQQPSTVVFALGDSFTFGMGVRDESTWPARLEGDLRRRTGQPIVVVNGGTISYGVFQELDLLRATIASLKPRIVVHALYWNDWMSARAPAPDEAPAVTADGFLAWDDQNVRRTRLRALAAWMSRHSALVTAARGLFSRSDAWGGGYGAAFSQFVARGLTPEEWRPIDEFYSEFAALARTAGFEPFVVIMPVDDVANGTTPASHPYAAEARRRLTHLGIPFVDAFTLWEREGLGKELFLPQGHDSHLNAMGYDVIATALADSLMAHPRTGAALAPRLPR
jgi:lysophospholipase L1-like esterase